MSPSRTGWGGRSEACGYRDGARRGGESEQGVVRGAAGLERSAFGTSFLQGFECIVRRVREREGEM